MLDDSLFLEIAFLFIPFSVDWQFGQVYISTFEIIFPQFWKHYAIAFEKSATSLILVTLHTSGFYNLKFVFVPSVFLINNFIF